MLSKTLLTTALIGAGCIHSLTAVELSDIEIHGFASMGYLKSSDNNYLGQSKDGTFEFNEFGLNFRTQIDDKTSFGLQFFSRDLGALGNNDVDIDWAYLDHQINDQFGVRIGRVKLPGALYSEYQDIDAVRTSILMPQGIYNLGFRDTTVGVDGLTLYGNLQTSSMGDFDYNLYYGTLPIKKDGSVIRAFSTQGLEDTESDLKDVFGGNLVWNTPVDGLRVGISYQQLNDWTFTGNSVTKIPAGPGFTKLLVPAEFNTDTFVIKSASLEYSTGDWVFVTEANSAKGRFVSPFVTIPVNWGSWYVQASYELNEKWSFSTYYMNFLEDADDTDGSESTPDFKGWQKDIALSTRYNINESWNVKAEFHIINGAALVSSADDNPDPEEDWTLFAIKSTVSF